MEFMCVSMETGLPCALAMRHSVCISRMDEPGVYAGPSDTPHAPQASARSHSWAIRSI